MLAELLSPERVRLGLNASSKEGALVALSSLLALPEGSVDVNIDEGAIYTTLSKREALASTGIGSGVAIPHGRLDGLGPSRAAIAIQPQGVDFQAVDGQPVRILVAILGDSDSHREHLTVLAHLSRNLREERFRARLLESQTAEDVLKIMLQ